MKLVVNRSVCMRSSQCSYMHPTLFREGDDGFPVVLIEHPEGEQIEEAQDACDICPSQAIKLVDGKAETP
jgi:ferredoxin